MVEARAWHARRPEYAQRRPHPYADTMRDKIRLVIVGFHLITTLQGQLAAQLARPLALGGRLGEGHGRRTGGGGGDSTPGTYSASAHALPELRAFDEGRYSRGATTAGRGAVLDDVVAFNSFADERARTFTLFSRPLCATSSTCASSADGWCVSAGCEDWTPHIDAPCTLHRAHAFGWGGRRELGVLRR